MVFGATLRTSGNRGVDLVVNDFRILGIGSRVHLQGLVAHE
jgi:hypothetical protein